MVSFIEDHRDVFGVGPICNVLPIAPATFYARAAIMRDPDLASIRAKRDVIELLPDSELTPTALAEAVSRASQRSPAALTLDTNGAKNSARLLAAAVRQRPAPGC